MPEGTRLQAVLNHMLLLVVSQSIQKEESRERRLVRVGLKGG